MTRVTKVEERTRTMITVDGHLSADSIGVVESCCNLAQSVGKPVELLLGNITVIDPAGRALLMRLSDDGVQLVAKGDYISYVVEDLTANEPAPALAGRRPRRR